MTEETIDLLTWYRHFSYYDSVEQAKTTSPTMWELRRAATVQWLNLKAVING